MATKRIRSSEGKFPYTFKSNKQRARVKTHASKTDTTIQDMITKAMEKAYALVMAGK